MSKKFLIISIFFTFVWFIFQYFLSGLVGLLSWIIEMVLLSFFVAGTVYIFQRKKEHYRLMVQRSFLIFWIVTGSISSVILCFSLYHNLFPWALGKITLSDGSNTIVFYQMSHIATQEFYRDVAWGITQLSASGFIVYAEGVRPWTPENHEKFNKLLGMKLWTGTYDFISGMIGLKSQDDTLFSWVEPMSLINVDISIDDIVNLAWTWALLSNQDPPVDIEAELSAFKWIQTSWLLEYIFRGILNFSIKWTTTGESTILVDTMNSSKLMPSGIQEVFMDTIVDKRNSYIVDYYMKHSPRKSVFVYGALHFPWIFDLLKKRNPNWHIESIEPIYPYRF